MKHLLYALAASLSCAAAARAATPNVVLIFADDLGYADVGCFAGPGGAPAPDTPHLDKLAKQGVRLTDFHVSQAVCSASRASLLTGCYANRIGIHGALGPNARHGLHADETTLAEVCKSRGYATGMVGKWHLGHHPQFLPTRHGFDSYFGLPYSNDMWPEHPEAKKGTYPPLPLFENETVVNGNVTAADQSKLTAQYTERAVKFIAENKAKPFFLYVAHSMPHVPLFVSDQFKGKSKQGLYSEVIQEIDWSVGEILKALDEHKLARDTLVIFTSDNGPWLSYGNHAGSAGSLREGKGTSWEGGTRVPFIARWPEKIPAGATCDIPAMTIDLLPTVAKLIGAKPPERKIDGRDVFPLLQCAPDADMAHEAYFHYYATNELQAVRTRAWKLILPHTYRTMQGQPAGKDGTPGRYKQVKIEKPELYRISQDPSETQNVAAANPKIVTQLLELAEKARTELGDSLTQRTGTGTREPGRVANGAPPAASAPKKEGKDGSFAAELIFPLHKQHNHAPGIVECPNGDLLVSWYRGSGERSADDVAVYGARKKAGADKWSDAFLMADTPGFPDCNTTMWVDKDGKLWLFWPLILANSWESCLTSYRVSSDYQTGGAPKWEWQGTIPLKPKDFEGVMLREFEAWKKQVAAASKMPFEPDPAPLKKVGDKLLSRLGWQPRCKPVVLSTGRVLLPLYSDTYDAGLMALSDDGGKTWTASQPLAGFGSIQPAVLERKDGTLVAYMRENGVFKKVRACESKDRGESWGTVYSTDLINPGSGLDAVRLASGNWLIVYNDTVKGRSRLAVSLSDDEGKTWKWTRHLEKHETGQYHYPAVIQSKDGAVHAVYSYFVADGKSMKHARFDEAWVKQGDGR
ncbi:sulfatase-like hydrolase/transferase [Gemmata sp. JC673]|uniref:Sulfatase-like hydrolase/transferase n=1 Tax=Gemmata algarum TaxID=2975278 RepID=A0ABU5EWH8_9BACT|nr:sulfatase-like hydrolase/transferase [Gemmata algarum]MDY3558812.1 sulfatase-like hydrolase/transferase [Gemmata algarum]